MPTAGRPSIFSEEVAQTICDRLALGESLRKICEDPKLPGMTTVIRWLGDEKFSSFRAQYAQAREKQAEFYAAEIIEIADDGSRDSFEDEDGNVRVNQEVVARSRLRVDARKWYASKLAPKKYGDRIELANDPENPVTKPLDIVDVAKKIAFVFALAQDKMKPEGETSAAAERQATTKELRHGLHT